MTSPAETPYRRRMAGTKDMQDVYLLLVDAGRRDGDGLPDGATGAAILCYSAGRDEAEAVREAVALLKTAGMAPLDVSSYGTVEEQRAAGIEVGPDEMALMDRARNENAVVVIEISPHDD